MKHRTRRLLPLITVFVLVVALVPLLAETPPHARARQSDNPLYNEVQLLEPEIVNTYPHSTGGWTQGLLVVDGTLYESTGRSGDAMLRTIDLTSGSVQQTLDAPDGMNTTGLARVDDMLIQLTLADETAFVYDLNTLSRTGEFSYSGAGWGLCAGENYIYMSDGTPFIDLRDRETFELIVSFLVTVQGSTVDKLNELECVGDYIYANVRQSDFIVQIDKRNGVVVGVIDTAVILTDAERAQFSAQEVLNGIAYLPESDTFLITGNNWPKLYEVRFVEADR